MSSTHRNFNRDELYLLASKMDLPTLLKFCSTSNKVNNLICRADKIWQEKLSRDFPDYYKLYEFETMSLRALYIKLYQLKIFKEKLNIPRDIYDLYLEEDLFLSKRELTEIPKEIAVFDNLKDLHLNGNLITSVPKEIGNLIHLNMLWLNFNRITEIPDSIGNLVNLKDLYLNNNNIETLPTSMGKLKALKSLGLSRNKITKLPVEICILPNLKHIGLENNPLSEIPVEFATVKRNKTLIIIFDDNVKYPAPFKNIPKILIKKGWQNTTTIAIPRDTSISYSWWYGWRND